MENVSVELDIFYLILNVMKVGLNQEIRMMYVCCLIGGNAYIFILHVFPFSITNEIYS